MLSTFLLMILALLGAFAAGPHVLVVNSIPACTPVSSEDNAAALASKDTQRLPLYPATISAVLGKSAHVPVPDWKTKGKVSSPRRLMAKLAQGVDVAEVNAYLQNATPWSAPGSTWMLHPRGDYDFTEVSLTAILYLFGERPDRLYPQTVQHMLEVLLLEEGGTPTLKVPRTFGLVFDTENHILMTESSRYLKNQWLRKHGSTKKKHDNARNGLQQWMLEHLNNIRTNGFHEFNSVPYQRYALQAVLNLEAFAEPPEIAAMARRILDDQIWRYACAALPATPGGLDLRSSIPFRRQLRYIRDPRLDLSYLDEAVPQWAAAGVNELRDGDAVTTLLPYRPPQETADFARVKPYPYYVQIGHGPKSCPEILSGGPGYVLSAGGAFRGSHKEIVPRATVLLLEDGAQTSAQCFHIPGGEDFEFWNNTGVHRRFACGNAPVHIPPQYKPQAERDGWSIFTLPAPAPLCAAVYNGSAFGLLALFNEPASSAAPLLADLIRANPDPHQLRSAFQWPHGAMLEYEVDAPPGAWTITAVDRRPANRDYDRWPLYSLTREKEAF